MSGKIRKGTNSPPELPGQRSVWPLTGAKSATSQSARRPRAGVPPTRRRRAPAASASPPPVESKGSIFMTRALLTSLASWFLLAAAVPARAAEETQPSKPLVVLVGIRQYAGQEI